MKKRLLVLFLVLVVVLTFGACRKNAFKDGTYEGEFTSEENDVTKVNMTIEEGKITVCETTFLDREGNIKDENYCSFMKEDSPENYEAAQKAVEGMYQYPEKVVEAGTIGGLEAISGATQSFDQFKAAVQDALSKAK